MVGRTGKTPEVLPRYARLLGARGGRVHREASEAARACLTAMRFRFPDALDLVELVIRLGEVGAYDLIGSVKQIADHIGDLLGEPPPDAAKLQRAMRAVCGKTCLVERQSRQLWRLCLAGLCDPTSPQHRRLLEETPSPYRLGTPELPGGRDTSIEAELRRQLAEALGRLREAEAQCQAACAGRSEIEIELRAARGELARLGADADMLRRERDEAVEARRDQGAVFERELGAREQQLREQEATLSALRRELAVRDEELHVEREHRQLADETPAPTSADECRQLEELLLDREIALEEAGRQLAALREEHASEAAALREQVRLAESTAADEAARSAGLRALLKDERDRRRAAESRVRRLQAVLRVKIVDEDDVQTPLDPEKDRECFVAFRRLLEEHIHAQEDELRALGQQSASDQERLAELARDLRVNQAFERVLAQEFAEDLEEGRQEPPRR